MSVHELRKALKRVVREARGKAERELALVLGFKEIQSEEVIGRFLRRLEELEVQKINQNYNASYHFSKGLLQNLLALVTPGEVVLSTHDYLKRWSQLIKEYRESST
jgi:DNA gyrase/topoisomerase IV subunit A